jgi:hypothetical protein
MMDRSRIEAQLSALTRNVKPPARHRRFRLYLALALAVPAPAVAYAVDTRLFPVVSDLNFSIYSDAPENETRVSFIFTKRRDCAPVSIEYFKTGDPIVAINVIESPTMIRYPSGRNIVGPFRLAVNREEFITKGVLLMRHRCHSLWLHTSRWFN